MIQSSPKVHHLCFGRDGMAYTHVFKLPRPSFLHYVSSMRSCTQHQSSFTFLRNHGNLANSARRSSIR
ncbi:hypothetical protein CGRA01v4_07494 [Colletotrichum graminicola]|nr:hypothetical protein CGRA01v4_07494 [Colletotrichum graminicola]